MSLKMNITMNNVKNKHLLTPFEEILRKKYNTPEKMRAFEKRAAKFAQKCKKESLAELGEEVRKARKNAGVTQEQLANMLNTKKSVISRVEKGDQNLTVEYIIKIAIALGRQFEVRIY